MIGLPHFKQSQQRLSSFFRKVNNVSVGVNKRISKGGIEYKQHNTTKNNNFLNPYKS